MGWLAILKGVLQLAAFVARQVERRQLIAEGESRVILKSLEDSNARLQKAAKIRRDIGGIPLDADGDGLSDDDGFKRD